MGKGFKAFTLFLFAFFVLFPVFCVAFDYSSKEQSTDSGSPGSLYEYVKQGYFVLEGGIDAAHQGEDQHIDIQGLIGNRYTVNNYYQHHAVAGIGYFTLPEIEHESNFNFGLKAFYLPSTRVTGNVVQENLYTNLSYQYSISHLPIYVMAKSRIPFSGNTCISFTIDAGVGPNIMHLDSYRERSLDGSTTIPDNNFASNTAANLSATLGLGLRFDNSITPLPVECGYRLFYLGRGHFKNKSNEMLDPLHTGRSFAHAILCSVNF